MEEVQIGRIGTGGGRCTDRWKGTDRKRYRQVE
jgi:hypothetical protein